MTDVARRNHPDPTVPLLAQLLSEKPDLTAVADPERWAAIQRAAVRHRLAPLVAYTVRTHVTGAALAWCDQMLAASWKKYRQSLTDLEFAAGLLHERGIQPLALKGPVTAARHYRPAFLRKPSGDLDLGIRDAQFGQAVETLVCAGYTPAETLRRARAFDHHLVMSHPKRMTIELHFRLSHGPFGLPVDPFFDTAVPYRLPNGVEVLTLQGADELLHLALHAVGDRFTPFFNLYEFRRISASCSPDTIRRAVEKAIMCHFAGVFSLIDAAFQAVWHETFVPPDMTLPTTWLQGRINENLYFDCVDWVSSDRVHTLRSRLRGRWLDFQTTDRVSDALRMIAFMSRFALVQLRNRGWRTIRVGGVRRD
jgi:hypothetical protein